MNIRLRTRKIKNIESCISVKEYAARHFISPSAVIRRISKGKLIGYKIKGSWFVNDQETR